MTRRVAGGARPRPAKQRRGPLVPVEKVLRKSGGLYEQGLVLLVCGHMVRSNSTGRARCSECAEKAEEAG